MKKLLILGSGSYGGPLSTRIIGLGRHLTEYFEVTMMVPSADKYNNFTPKKNINTPGIKLIQPWQFTTHSPMLNLLPYLLTSLYQVLRTRYDVVYLYKPTPITVCGIVPRLLFRTPVILDMDDLGSEVMKLEGQSAFAYTLVRLCENMAMKFATAIVVTTTYLQEHVAGKYPNKKILVLPNGTEPSENSVKSTAKLRPAVYYFGQINRLDIIEELLQAMPEVLAQVPSATLTIAGGGRALDTSKKLVDSLGIRQATNFTGMLPNSEAVQHYIRYGDIAVCFQPDGPTNRAASNMKVFLYMALSSAVVVSDVGDLKRYVNDGEAGIAVAPGDRTGLANAIVYLLEHSEVRMRMARAARQRVEKMYAWSKLAEKLNDFICNQSVKPPKHEEQLYA